MGKLISLVTAGMIAMFAFTGCSSSSSGGSDSQSATEAKQAAPGGENVAACATPSSGDPGLDQALSGLGAPSGGTVVGTQAVGSTNSPGSDDAIVRVCAQGLKGNALKDYATSVALKIKKSKLSSSIASLRVTNLANGDDPTYRVRCEDFGTYTFMGVEGTSRAAWKFPNED